MKTVIKHEVSSTAKITAGLCEEGKFIRVEGRGTILVLYMAPHQADHLREELSK